MKPGLVDKKALIAVIVLILAVILLGAVVISLLAQGANALEEWNFAEGFSVIEDIGAEIGQFFTGLIDDLFGTQSPTGTAPTPLPPQLITPIPAVPVEVAPHPYALRSFTQDVHMAVVENGWIYFAYLDVEAFHMTLARMPLDGSVVEPVFSFPVEHYSIRVVGLDITDEGNFSMVLWSAWGEHWAYYLEYDRDGNLLLATDLRSVMAPGEGEIFGYEAIFLDDGTILLWGIHFDGAAVQVTFIDRYGVVYNSPEELEGNPLLAQDSTGRIFHLGQGLYVLNEQTLQWENFNTGSRISVQNMHSAPGWSSANLYLETNRGGGRGLYGFDWNSRELFPLLYWADIDLNPPGAFDQLLIVSEDSVLLLWRGERETVFYRIPYEAGARIDVAA